MAMQEEDFERNGGVGKSSLIRRFCKGTFTDQYKKTIGVDFLEKQQYISNLGENVRLMLWDTAGQEEFDSMTRSYYRGAGACVLAFSTTDRQSFEVVEKWKNKVETECGKIPMVLIQNKIDLIDKAVLTSEEAEGLAVKLSLRFYRTSVKDNFNVNEVFEYLAEQYVKYKNKQQSASDSSGTQIASVDFGSTPKKDNSKQKESGDENGGDEATTGDKSFQLQAANTEQEKKKKKKSYQRCVI